MLRNISEEYFWILSRSPLEFQKNSLNSKLWTQSHIYSSIAATIAIDVRYLVWGLVDSGHCGSASVVTL